jgi:hypothetical protein
VEVLEVVEQVMRVVLAAVWVGSLVQAVQVILHQPHQVKVIMVVILLEAM